MPGRKWKSVSLADLGLLQDGDWILNQDYSRSGVRLLQVGDVGLGEFIGKSSRWVSLERADKLKCTFLHEGDILISRMADPVGRACVLPELPYPSITAVDVAIFRIDEERADRGYIVHALNYSKTLLQAERLATGVTRKRISRLNLERVRIPLPPFPEQRAIARVLRAVQAAREARQREVTLERERKAALMAHLFTHGTRGEPTKQTPIGEMPASWGIRTLGELSQVMSGGTPSRMEPAYFGGNIPWVKTGEIDYGTIATTEETITQEGLQNSSARIIPAGTLLMAMYGQGITRGRVAILGIDAAINQACAAIFISQAELITDYAFHYLAYSYESIRNLGHGANQKNLNAMLVRSIPIALPPTIEEQRKIADVLCACDAKIAALKQESALLDELFRALLEELMTGRVGVAEDDGGMKGLRSRA